MIKHAWRRTYPDTRIISQQYCTFILRLSDKSIYKFVHGMKIQKKTVFHLFSTINCDNERIDGKVSPPKLSKNFGEHVSVSLLRRRKSRGEKWKGIARERGEEGQRERKIYREVLFDEEISFHST